MKSVRYGSTDLVVSRLCYGTGPIGGILNDLPDERGADLLEYAFERGVNFWDTAQGYDSHRHVRAALRRVDRGAVVINTKTGAQGKSEGRAAIERALDEMGLDYVDSMMLHGVEHPADFESRRGCLEALLEAKADGRVRHVGASSHIYTGAVLELLAETEEIEIVLCHMNMEGRGLVGGDVYTHRALVERLYESGKAISIMKVMDAGTVGPDDAEEWISWSFEYPHAHSINLGMWREREIDFATRIGSRVGPKSPVGAGV